MRADMMSRTPELQHRPPSAGSLPPVATSLGKQAASTRIFEVVEALQQVEALDGLATHELCWLAANGSEHFTPGQTVLFRENEPAHHLFIVLTGEILVRRRNEGAVTSVARTGQITGKLPFSRMVAWAAEGTSAGPLWLLHIHEDAFPAMLRTIPTMAQRCVSILLDRVRDFTRADLQSEKLSALGRLAANVSHELKNPASASERAAQYLATLLDENLRSCRLGRLFESDQELDAYQAWVSRSLPKALDQAANQSPHALSESDREDRFTSWLDAHHVPNAWNLAPALAHSNLHLDTLDELSTLISKGILPAALTHFCTLLDGRMMMRTISVTSARIFHIVAAIQDYSYMDQAPVQQIDLNRSVENALAVLPSTLHQLRIIRDYDPSSPTLIGYGAELSQVWTALIENAIDALSGRGVLRVSTRLADKTALVEFWDDGPGVDPAITSRIFEPFFTTKPLGSALGLGLDLVRRLVGKHFGSVSVQSRPHETCFQVRLPLDRPQIY